MHRDRCRRPPLPAIPESRAARRASPNRRASPRLPGTGAPPRDRAGRAGRAAPAAPGLLHVPEVAVPDGEGGEPRPVELERRGRIDHVEAVLLVDRLAAHDSPASGAQLEEVVEPPRAGHVHLGPVDDGPLLDLHLGLRDRAAPGHLAAEAAEEVRDIHAVLEPGPADRDELGVRPLEPGRGHPAVVMPDPRELVPPSRVPQDDPVFDDLPDRRRRREVKFTVHASILPVRG